MATQEVGESGGEDAFHSPPLLLADGYENHGRDMDLVAVTPPQHPVAALQAAFEESILESADSSHARDSRTDNEADAHMRRRKFPDAHRPAGKREQQQVPGARYHPVVKAMAQIVFGLHLLVEDQAESNEEVVKILQNHVNEIDAFLERTSDEFRLAIGDIQERIQHLKLPMQHMDIFQVMLDEKRFRMDLMNGNERIEKIIDSTRRAMNAATSDIDSGLKSTQELSKYLITLKRRWPANKGDVAEVLAAMHGNEQGWLKYLKELTKKSDTLRENLKALEILIAQITAQAAAASRRNKSQSKCISPAMMQQPGTRSSMRSKVARDVPVYKKPGGWLDKPLPNEPSPEAGVRKAAQSTPHQTPLPKKEEKDRQPVRGSRSVTTGSLPKPSTSSGPPANTDPDVSETNGMQSLQELAEFLRGSDPLRSHPPDKMTSRPTSKKPGPPQNQGTNPLLTSTATKAEKRQFRRSKSMGAILTVNPRELKLIPRKPVGSASTPQTERAASPIAHSRNEPSPALSRRLSKKLKILHPMLSSDQLRSDTSKRPIDSAHSEVRPSDDTAVGENRPSESQVNEKEPPKHATADASQQRDEMSRTSHSLFPKSQGPLAPTQATTPSPNLKASTSNPKLNASTPFPNRNNTQWYTESGGEYSPRLRAHHSYTASRTASLRRFFHARRGTSQSVTAS